MIGHIDKWGNSLGIRIPSKLAAALMLTEGSDVEFAVEKGRLVISPKKRPSLKALLADYPEDGERELRTGNVGKEDAPW